MTDASQSTAKPRAVDIDSAIGHSSYQLPVFVALNVEGGEAQVVKTFAAARDVFDHVFSIMLNRLQQRRAVEKVEMLVPASAHLKNSANTEYVLVVRGKAIFWFSSAAAKRAAGRRLLLEHARELADAEQAPFYVLNTRAKKIRVAVVACGLVTLPVLLVVVGHLPVHWSLPSHRRNAERAAPIMDGSNNAETRPFESEVSPGVPPRSQRRSFADFDITTGMTPANTPFPDPVSKLPVIARSLAAKPAWPSHLIRAPEVVHVSPTAGRDGPLPADSVHARRNSGTTPGRRKADAGDPVSHIYNIEGTFPKHHGKANSAFKASALSEPPPPHRPE